MEHVGADPTSADSITAVSRPQTPTITRHGLHPEQPLKLKGRQRLLQGLRHMSSSQSLARSSRNASSGYKLAGKASVSCISFSSAATPEASYSSSLTTELSHGYSTAPTSACSTPGIQIPMFDDKARIKYLAIAADGRVSAPLPTEFRPSTRIDATPSIVEERDYFSRPIQKSKPARSNFNFWQDLPSELRIEVLSYLEPKQVVQSSAVSKAWHRMCFDGQLWAVLNTSEFYQHIPANALVSIIISAGPFIRDLNLRGCVQLRERWHAKGLSDACRNLESFTLEGCRIDRSSIHTFLHQNSRLVHLNLSGLAGATNAAMKIIAQHCPKLEHLNISWCNNIDTRGLRRVVEACPSLSDLRAGEIRGWDDLDFIQELFEKNTLERLVLMNCDSFGDESLGVLMEGKDSEMDFLTGRPVVAPRRLRHLDMTRCRAITDKGLRTCIHNLPDLEGLQLSKCGALTDVSISSLLPTLSRLTHLDLEELDELTNVVLTTLAQSPCARSLRHLSISYCEKLGDAGMIPLLKSCTNLRSLDMDNTRASDLALAEAAAMVRKRGRRTTNPLERPTVGLRLAAYDCQNVNWTGVREVLSRNGEVLNSVRRVATTSGRPLSSKDLLPGEASQQQQPIRTYPTEFIQLKCFYNYQPTVDEHTKRISRGDFHAAIRLERKWAEFMMAQEEAGATGAGSRRRRRRAREAQMMHADEEDPSTGTTGGVGGGRRRRARSGGCAVM